MPIINGVYVQDSLGDPKAAQQQVFGSYRKKDMADYSNAAYNYLMKQQEQAYNLQLWNLMNEYNTPAAQMQRFQDAGLNPNLIYSQQNTTTSPQAASSTTFRPGGTMSKNVQAGMSVIQQLLGTVKAARETYDYMKFGRSLSATDLLYKQEAAHNLNLQNEWNRLLLEGPSSDPESREYMLGNGPRYQAYQQQVQERAQRIRQIGALIQHYGKTDERFDKLMQLDDQRLSQMKGQYDFILHGFDTGNDTLNEFLRMLMFFGLNSGL